MKHSFFLTLKILGWTAACGLLGFFVAPYVQSKVIVPTANPYLIAGVAIGMLLGSAVLWYFALFKWFKSPKSIDIAMSVAIGLAFERVCELLFNIGKSGNWIDNLLAKMCVYIVVAATYYAMIKRMQYRWRWVVGLMWLNNLFMVVTIGLLAAMLGAMLSPFAAILIFIGASIYDAIAVWKIGSMQQMAMKFIRRRIIPGIGVTKQKGKIGILGGGDLFFLVFVPVSFYKTSMTMMVSTMIGLYVGLVVLFFIARKKEFYPALPFMLVGMLIGGGIGWLLL
jgi:hypothetical protein